MYNILINLFFFYTHLYLQICFCTQKSLWQRLRKSINGLSNHRFSIKPYDFSKYDIVFCNYPTTTHYLQHRQNLTNGVGIGLTDDYPILIHLVPFRKK